MIADGKGRAVAFALAPGQGHELPMAPGLLARMPDVPLWVVGDKGYSSNELRETINNKGSRAAIPTRSNEAAIDALYFTVTTLTTTGYGDITLQGKVGRLLAVIIMIVGVSLFLRLVQVIFRPQKVHYTCPDCGLGRHDQDAVHCKHCGRVLPIYSEGD